VGKCPQCEHDNDEGAVICTYCGAVLDPGMLIQQTQTRNFGDSERGENYPRWGASRFDEQTQLILRVVESGEIIRVDGVPLHGIMLGRYDPITGIRPEVDLTDYRADELGVSRQHARLTVLEGSMYITDLGGPNATYLNGLRLLAHQPRILRDGDEIRLAHLKLQINFIDATKQRNTSV
jgi:transcription initiation factor TFIIIB Brf1 subunit/transcription initiation factor TFIIB